MTPRALLLAACLALAGCPSAASVPMADAPDRLGTTWCERLEECNVLGLLLLSQTQCELAAWQFRNDSLALLDQWVADGTVTYDGEAMATCLDDLDAASCQELANLITDVGACGDAFVGTVAADGACEGTLQCAPGLYCDESAACPGSCQPRGGQDAACSGDASCQAGFHCDTGACAPILLADAVCDSAFACAPGFVCDIPSGQPTGTCKPMTFDVPVGQPCSPSTGAFCAAPGVCAELDTTGDSWECRAVAAAGDPCNVGVPNPCAAGAVCVTANNEVTGTCTTLPGENETCLTSSGLVLTCQEMLACDDTTNTCVPKAENGGACTIADQCAVSCDSGTCSDPTCVN